MITKQELIDLVESEAKMLALNSSRLQVYGSELGAAILPHLEGFNLKAEYGGLGRFVESHCSNFLNHVDKRGGNDVYQYTPPSTSGGKNYPVVLSEDQNITFWKAFVTPGIQSNVWIQHNSGSLSLNGGLLQGLWIEIEKVTSQEHRRIVSDFLDNYPPTDQQENQELKSLIEQPEYWPAWSSRIRKGVDGSSNQDWTRFRKYRLESLFADRLTSLAIDNQAQEKAKLELITSRRIAFVDPPTPPRQEEALAAPADGTIQIDQVRTAIHRAVERMSIDQLLSLKLPLGSLFQELR